MDLKIYGQGSSAGGKYNKVSIMGEGKIAGDVDCLNIKIYGEGEILGNLKVNDGIDVKGHANIKGDLEGEKLKIQGDVQVYGASVEKAEIMGNITTKNDFNAEKFKLEGGFNIGSLLNADEIEISLYWPCKAREIGGSKIKVKKDSKLSFLGLKNMIKPNECSKELIADIIEGDNLYLEYTKARVVRGNNIELGPGCEIELVEYKNDFKQDEKTKVTTYKEI
jgi:cytoskeletal protein CcmA (bactofilin family)